MEKFKTRTKSLGKVFVGEKQIIKFKSEYKLEDIKELKSSCSCSTPIYDKETKVLKVTYKPKPVPRQRISIGHYSTEKLITIIYEDGSLDQLSFTAKVYKK